MRGPQALLKHPHALFLADGSEPADSGPLEGGDLPPLFSTPPPLCPLAMSSHHQSLKHLKWEAMCERGQNWEQPSLSTLTVLFTSITIKSTAVFLST